MVGVLFFFAGIHSSRAWMLGNFESVWWNAYVHRLDLGLYSYPKEFWGQWSQNPCWIHGKNPLYQKNSPQRKIELMMLRQAGQWAEHTTNEHFITNEHIYHNIQRFCRDGKTEREITVMRKHNCSFSAVKWAPLNVCSHLLGGWEGCHTLQFSMQPCVHAYPHINRDLGRCSCSRAHTHKYLLIQINTHTMEAHMNKNRVCLFIG